MQPQSGFVLLSAADVKVLNENACLVPDISNRVVAFVVRAFISEPSKTFDAFFDCSLSRLLNLIVAVVGVAVDRLGAQKWIPSPHEFGRVSPTVL